MAKLQFIFSVAVLSLVAISSAQEILQYQIEGVNSDGSYKYSFKTSNGISAQEEGRVKDKDSYEVVGFYQYTSKEGVPVSILYLANENGFQAQGDAIPTPPPIPPLILRSLAYNAAHPEQEEEEEEENRKQQLRSKKSA